MRFVTPGMGWTQGTYGTYRSTDGGTTWTIQDTATLSNLSLYALDENTIFHAGWNGIRRTTDGGASWETVDTAAFWYYKFQFLSPRLGFAAGAVPTPDYKYNPSVRRTTDGGTTWQTLWTGTGAYEFEGASFTDSLNGWAITYMGLMYHSTDGGWHWAFQDTVGPYGAMRDVQFTTRDSGWAVGGLGGLDVIARTTDAGTTWTYTLPGGSSFHEITMLNSQTGWCVGANNNDPFIARTTDGGESWQTQYPNPHTAGGFMSISMLNASLGWIAGENSGLLYKTTNGGVTAVEEPGRPPITDFRLEQNYPNPFNPTTTIEYTIGGVVALSGVEGRAYTNVTLRVYDILGRELATLVDEMKQPGTHTVLWDATGIASGVYLYRLTAGAFTQTRTMTYIR